eukprot:Skav217900  [mRNA]  locus=scaffold795:62601:76625:+ [translate_table: standard]
MINGYRSHYVFLGAVTFLGSTGVISTEQALAGFSSPGNIAFQAVLLLVAGIQDSGVLDHIFSRLLGTRETHTKAFVRVQLVTAMLGAVVQQTTVVVAAAPALQRWAPRTGWSPREVLLPVSTVGAVSQNLVIVTSTVALTIYQTMPEAELQMLDPALACIILTFITIIYCTLLAKPLLSPAGKENHRDNSEHMMHQLHNRYFLSFEVAKGSFLINSTIEQAGLLSMPGAVLVDTDFSMDERMASGNRLNFAATASGVAQIRNRSPGLVLKGLDPLAVLGAQRHRRRLFEVGIAPGSSLIGCAFSKSVSPMDVEDFEDPAAKAERLRQEAEEAEAAEAARQEMVRQQRAAKRALLKEVLGRATAVAERARQAVLERKKLESVEENKKAEAELRRKARRLRAPRDLKFAEPPWHDQGRFPLSPAQKSWTIGRCPPVDIQTNHEVVAQKEPEVEQIYEAAPAADFEAETMGAKVVDDVTLSYQQWPGSDDKRNVRKNEVTLNAAESAAPAAPVAVPEAPAAAPAPWHMKNKFSALMGSDDEDEEED